MSAVAVSACSCAIWEPALNGQVRQCPEHFHIFRDARRLTSVGRIVGASFPLDPSIPPAVLENARDRGSATDQLFGAYALGTLRTIPAGTRRDAYDLFVKLQRWFDRQNFKKIEVQVLLGGEDHGGVLDFRFDGMPVDLKCTSKVEHSHRMQTALYAKLMGAKAGAILHATERINEARLIPLEHADFDDSEILLAHWRMLRRRRPDAAGY